jgi:hypothetical protein
LQITVNAQRKVKWWDHPTPDAHDA